MNVVPGPHTEQLPVCLQEIPSSPEPGPQIVGDLSSVQYRATGEDADDDDTDSDGDRDDKEGQEPIPHLCPIPFTFFAILPLLPPPLYRLLPPSGTQSVRIFSSLPPSPGKHVRSHAAGCDKQRNLNTTT